MAIVVVVWMVEMGSNLLGSSSGDGRNGSKNDQVIEVHFCVSVFVLGASGKEG